MDIFTKAVLITGMVMGLVWIVVTLANINKFDEELASVPRDQYRCINSMIFGFAIVMRWKINMQKTKNAETMKKFSDLYGSRYAGYYFYVERASEIGWCWLALTLGFIATGLTNTAELLALSVAAAALGVLYRKTEVRDHLDKRENELVSQFPAALSKMTLLVGAGLTMREAWREIAEGGSGVLYDEMKKVVNDKENGATDEVAFGQFSERCNEREIRKFAMSTVQNMKKGNREQVEFLKDMSSEMWDMKKKLVKKRVEDMKTLLLIPTFMIFIGILIMVMGPMLSSIGASF